MMSDHDVIVKSLSTATCIYMACSSPACIQGPRVADSQYGKSPGVNTSYGASCYNDWAGHCRTSSDSGGHAHVLLLAWPQAGVIDMP